MGCRLKLSSYTENICCNHWVHGAIFDSLINKYCKLRHKLFNSKDSLIFIVSEEGEMSLHSSSWAAGGLTSWWGQTLSLTGQQTNNRQSTSRYLHVAVTFPALLSLRCVRGLCKLQGQQRDKPWGAVASICSNLGSLTVFLLVYLNSIIWWQLFLYKLTQSCMHTKCT